VFIRRITVVVLDIRRIWNQRIKNVLAFADNTIAVTKLVNSAMFANLDAYERFVQSARDM
jgi:hypothetical protein